MKDKNNVFTIKSKLQKICTDNEIMKSNSKLIEVKFAHTEQSHCDYDYGGGSWLEYESIGFFDNIEDAWKLVQTRVKKFHTKIKDYSFDLIEVNAKSESIDGSVYEQTELDRFEKQIIEEKKRQLDQNTLGWKCDTCKKIFKMHFNVEKDKTNHWDQHWEKEKIGIKWTRIIKKKKKAGDV